MSNPIDELNSKKNLLIKAILKTIKPYSNLSEKQLFEFVSKTINDTKAFLKEPTSTYIDIPFKSKYQKKCDTLSSTLSKISKINHNIKLEQIAPITFDYDVSSHTRLYPNNHTTHNVYRNYKSLFQRLNIPLALLEQVYSNCGKEEFLRYVRTIFKVDSKLNDYDFRITLENYNLQSQKHFPIKKVEQLLHEYNLKDVLELKNFYFNLNRMLLVHELKHQNQEKHKETIDYILDKTNCETLNIKILKKHIKHIENLFSNRALKVFLTTNNLQKDITSITKSCNLNNLTTNDYSSIVSSLLTLDFSSAEGVCEFLQDTNLIGLKSSIFSFNSTTQAGIIIHEYIHTLEIINKDDFNTFRKRYGAINEMLTEYLARIANKHYQPNTIFSKCDNSKETIYGYKFYDSKMSPLHNSPLLPILLKAKINGNLRELDIYVSKPILDKISKALTYEDEEIGQQIMIDAINDFKHLQKLYPSK